MEIKINSYVQAYTKESKSLIITGINHGIWWCRFETSPIDVFSKIWNQINLGNTPPQTQQKLNKIKNEKSKTSN